jgi:hypothetical protein
VAPAEHVERFYYLFFAGLGMLAIGGVNLLCPRMGLRGHAAISLAVSAAVLAGVAAWQRDAGLVANVEEPTTARRGAEPTAQERRFLNIPADGNHVIRWGEPTDGSNCHGWVFAGGRFWVGGRRSRASWPRTGTWRWPTRPPGTWSCTAREGRSPTLGWSGT